MRSYDRVGLRHGKERTMKRIQFELSEEYLDELEEMMRLTGIRTKKELVNNALSFLQWAINEKREGKVIASVDEKEDKYKEIIMPFITPTPKRLNSTT